MVDPRAIESHLLMYYQDHFQEPQGTPYTIPPLAPLLKYDSLMLFGQQIIQGTVNLNEPQLPHHTKLLLQHQNTWIPATYLHFILYHLKPCLMASVNGQNAHLHHCLDDTWGSTNP